MNFFEAYRFFGGKHKEINHLRKYSDAPYFTHCARVAIRVIELPDATEEDAIAALGHDYLEDVYLPHVEPSIPSGMHYLYKQGVPTKSVEYIVGLTNPSKEHPQLPRAERKKMDREHMYDAPLMVRKIKLLDRIDNLRDMCHPICKPDFAKLYLEESKELLKFLHDADAGLAKEYVNAMNHLDMYIKEELEYPS